MAWQENLEGWCRDNGIAAPVFQLVSDRRGGRTAWSSRVTVNGKGVYSGRYWYDGKNLYNAKDDAAEVACKILCPNYQPSNFSSPSTTRSIASGGLNW